MTFPSDHFRCVASKNGQIRYTHRGHKVTQSYTELNLIFYLFKFKQLFYYHPNQKSSIYDGGKYNHLPCKISSSFVHMKAIS
jgi:hypothetical protein